MMKRALLSLSAVLMLGGGLLSTLGSAPAVAACELGSTLPECASAPPVTVEAPAANAEAPAASVAVPQNTESSSASQDCTKDQIAEAQALARKVAELSKTQPDLALKMSVEVAQSRPACFQVAFGAVLDGVGTAATTPVPIVQASPG